VNFTKICRASGFVDVTQNVDMPSSKNLTLQHAIVETAARDPTATPPRPTGWEPLFYRKPKLCSVGRMSEMLPSGNEQTVLS